MAAIILFLHKASSAQRNQVLNEPPTRGEAGLPVELDHTSSLAHHQDSLPQSHLGAAAHRAAGRRGSASNVCQGEKRVCIHYCSVTVELDVRQRGRADTPRDVGTDVLTVKRCSLIGRTVWSASNNTFQCVV